MKTHPSERGQAMVLIILAIVGIFGFAALAVDLGQMFAARRAAQNAADAAALGAAYDAVSGSLDPATAVNLGYDLALVNGYNNDGENNEVWINNPPVGGVYCEGCEHVVGQEYYQALIKVHLNPIFAQIFYKGAQDVTVEAVAHAKTFDSATTGDAILSLDRVADDSTEFNGTTKVYVDGGNIRSDGGMRKTGASGKITVTNGGKVYYGKCETCFEGKPGPFNMFPEYDPPYGMTGMKMPTCPTSNTTINGVDYYVHNSGLSGTMELAPGIHCVKNGIGKGKYTGDDVLIVLLSGGFKQTGNDSFKVRAATDLKDANGTQWGGMVLYAPYSNTSEITFGGNSVADFYGVIYAPAAFCDIGGTPDGTGYHTAIICNQVRFHGTPDVRILYNSAELFHFPPMVELVQ